MPRPYPQKRFLVMLFMLTKPKFSELNLGQRGKLWESTTTETLCTTDIVAADRLETCRGVGNPPA
jgi:hypothetical protein